MTKIFLVTLLIVSVLATWWRLSLIGRRIVPEPKPLEGRSITPLATFPGWVTTPLSRRVIRETLRRVCRSPITGRRITPLATHVGCWKLRSYVFQKKLQWGRTKIILFILLFVSLLAILIRVVLFRRVARMPTPLAGWGTTLPWVVWVTMWRFVRSPLRLARDSKVGL